MGSIKPLDDATHSELDNVTFEILKVSQDIVNIKLQLERFTNEGQLFLAKSRYLMGGNSVSKLQLPNEDWPEFEAQFKIKSSSSEDAKFQRFSEQAEENSSSEQLTHRKKTEQSTDSKSEIVREKGTPAQDPLKWFGILIPNSLRQAQRSYHKAIELSLELANLQSQLEAEMLKKNHLEKVIEKELL